MRLSTIVFALAIVSALPGAGSAAQIDAHPTLTLDALRAKYSSRGAINPATLHVDALHAGQLVDIDGVQVYYLDEGQGPAILMVHGSVSTLKTYDEVAARLRGHYRVIRYDVPGQGLSGPVSDEAAQRLQPADIAEHLLGMLGVKRVTAVGVSSGGTLCMYLAARRPDLVQRLVLSNTPADPVDASHLRQPQAFVDAQREAQEAHFQSRNFWNLFLGYFAGEPERMTPAIQEQFYDFNRRVPDRNSLALVAKVADHAKAVEAMSQVTAPTLLVWGARDPLLTPATADALGAYLNHAQVSKLLLPDVGHFPPLEVPERFAAVVAAFIESVTPVEPNSPAPADR